MFSSRAGKYDFFTSHACYTSSQTQVYIEEEHWGALYRNKIEEVMTARAGIAVSCPTKGVKGGMNYARNRSHMHFIGLD